jgi:dihydrolipoamide dehydrogenase
LPPGVVTAYVIDHDLLVLGGGAGNRLARAGADAGLDAALVEPGPLGGACLTRGCDPSKSLIYRANVAETVREAESFGVDGTLDGIDWETIVEQSNAPFDAKAERLRERFRDDDDLTLYEGHGEFVDDRTVAVNDETVAAERVVIAVGAKPLIPPIEGIDDVDYLTSDDALRLDERPDSLVVIGGGYVAAELGHVYGALGSEVTILGRSDALLSREDPDVRERFTEIYERKYDVRTGREATAVETDGDEIVVTAEEEDGEDVEVSGDELLVATGREPATDGLGLETAGVETDDDGFVETDDRLRTSAESVWALGDVAGNHMFRHAATHEEAFLERQLFEGEDAPVEYPGMAHAVFSSPEVAGLGATEDDLDGEAGDDYAVGTREYDETPLGTAAKADGFAKVIAAPDGDVLGCHIVGPEASTLIHEVAVATARGDGTVNDVTETIHIHPAMNKVVAEAFADV